jgi:hypothetical protein
MNITGQTRKKANHNSARKRLRRKLFQHQHQQQSPDSTMEDNKSALKRRKLDRNQCQDHLPDSTMAEGDSAPKLALLTIAQELRDLIFKELLLSPNVVEGTKWLRLRVDTGEIAEILAAFRALCLTSKRVRTEVTEYFYCNNTFGLWLPSNHRTLGIPSSYYGHVKRFALYRNLGLSLTTGGGFLPHGVDIKLVGNEARTTVKVGHSSEIKKRAHNLDLMKQFTKSCCGPHQGTVPSAMVSGGSHEEAEAAEALVQPALKGLEKAVADEGQLTEDMVVKLAKATYKVWEQERRRMLQKS